MEITVVNTRSSRPETPGCQPTRYGYCLFPPRALFQWSCCHQSRPIATTPRHAGAWRPVVYPSTFPQVRFLRKRWGVKVKLCLGEEVWRMFLKIFKCEIHIFDHIWTTQFYQKEAPRKHNIVHTHIYHISIIICTMFFQFCVFFLMFVVEFLSY